MGLLGQAVDAIGSVADKLGISLPTTGKVGAGMAVESEFAKRLPELTREIWSVEGQDWYQIYGYQFAIQKYKTSKTAGVPSSARGFLKYVSMIEGEKVAPSTGEDGPPMIYTLPIPPQTLLVKPIMANRITPTLGGVVEEVSPVTFWMISMSGTTGTAIGRDPDHPSFDTPASKFRQIISTTGLLSGLASQANSILNKAGNFIDQISGGGVGDVIGAINNGLTPPLPYSGSAVSATSNGFTEMQNLSKFFYLYQRLKFSFPDDYGLFFINNKTKQKWRIAVKDFTVQQNAQNPHLYRYQIQIQGWDMQSADRTKGTSFDRFGPGGDLQSVNTTNVFDSINQIKSIGKNIFSGPATIRVSGR